MLSDAEWAKLGRQMMLSDREADLLPMRESVIYLGKGISLLGTADIPRHLEMIGSGFKRLGWDAGKFRAYRCRVEYPVMPSSVVVQFEPEKPGGSRDAE